MVINTSSVVPSHALQRLSKPTSRAPLPSPPLGLRPKGGGVVPSHARQGLSKPTSKAPLPSPPLGLRPKGGGVVPSPARQGLSKPTSKAPLPSPPLGLRPKEGGVVPSHARQGLHAPTKEHRPAPICRRGVSREATNACWSGIRGDCCWLGWIWLSAASEATVVSRLTPLLQTDPWLTCGQKFPRADSAACRWGCPCH